MGGKSKKKPVFQDDATKERLRHAQNDGADPWEFVDPSRIDSIQPIGLVRRFRATHLDRWYKRDKPEKSILTYRQWSAGDWYRNTYYRAVRAPSVIASYGERVTGGEPDYGLARTDAQIKARELWREARETFQRNMVGFMDRFLLHNELPRYGGGKDRGYAVSSVRVELDGLGDWLKLPKNKP